MRRERGTGSSSSCSSVGGNQCLFGGLIVMCLILGLTNLVVHRRVGDSSSRHRRFHELLIDSKQQKQSIDRKKTKKRPSNSVSVSNTGNNRNIRSELKQHKRPRPTPEYYQLADIGNSVSNTSNNGSMSSEHKQLKHHHQLADIGNAVSNTSSNGDMSLEHKQHNRPGPAHHRLAGISCQEFGGPPDDVATAEMVYWSDIPADAAFVSPFYDPHKYLTFEPDLGGWNNMRMAMETVLVLAHAMGRTLVLPPEQGISHLVEDKDVHKTAFTFNDFFHLDAIHGEQGGLNIITMDEFLTRKGGDLRSKIDIGKNVDLPLGGNTDWNGQKLNPLWAYLREVGYAPPRWDPDECVAVIPASPKLQDAMEMLQIMDNILNDTATIPDPEKDFIGNPVPVNGTATERLREIMATRNRLCIYDEEMQNVDLIHFRVVLGEGDSESRLLTHFYAFIFFQDWRQDLWSKRLVRDHLRYVDQIICAAARVVQAIRQRAEQKGTDPDGLYDSFHVRRGDFPYVPAIVDATQMYEISKDNLKPNGTLFIATDERDKSFFDPLMDRYDVCFLDDFGHLLKGINTNYFGMLDQLVASKGRVFYGTWWSTLSGYVNRMRGYYIAKHHLQGYQDGTMQSYYFAPEARRMQMRDYRAVKLPLYMREFPTSWRDIDKGVADEDEGEESDQYIYATQLYRSN